jgi:4-amino-4-deoxy-L-arabinose transferase-like glycosyltransferase
MRFVVKGDDSRDKLEAGIFAVLAVALGQLLLFALGPLTRASSSGIEAVGLAYLSADSIGYLRLASSPMWFVETPWNRVLYIALLRLGTNIGEPTTIIVIVQVLATVLATGLSYRIATRIAGRGAGMVASAVIAINPLTAQWVRFVLTESIFFSLVILVVWAGTSLVRQERSTLHMTSLLVGAALAVLLRPNGVLVLGSAVTLALLLIKIGPVRWLLLSSCWVLVGAGLLFGLAATGQPAERPLLAQITTGIVVEGSDRVIIAIAMPESGDVSDNSPTAVARYVSSHPVAYARLFASRIAMAAAQVRPHYPEAVNVAIGMAMMMLFVSTLLGATAPETKALRRATAIVGVPLLLLVGATFATPEGRYGWGALVALAPLAGIGGDAIRARATQATKHIIQGGVRAPTGTRDA